MKLTLILTLILIIFIIGCKPKEVALDDPTGDIQKNTTCSFFSM